MAQDSSPQRFYEENARRVYENMQRVEVDPSQYTPFLQLISTGGCVPDAGCGSGRDSAYFLQRGYRVVAMDASAALSRLAVERIGQPVIHQSFEEMEFDYSIDKTTPCVYARVDTPKIFTPRGNP